MTGTKMIGEGDGKNIRATKEPGSVELCRARQLGRIRPGQQTMMRAQSKSGALAVAEVLPRRLLAPAISEPFSRAEA